jgi:hypothetical protein
MPAGILWLFSKQCASLRNAKHRVPPAYSRADDYARSLYGPRDDEHKKLHWHRFPGMRAPMVKAVETFI